MTYPLRVPALYIRQPLGEFFVAAIPAEVLLQVAYTEPFHYEESGKPDGNQRQFKIERAKAIARYIDTVECAFPNSIILAANYERETGQLDENEDSRWRIEFSAQEKGFAWLIIPSSRALAVIVDGQHRLRGFEYVSRRERLQMPMLCAIYIDLPNPFQAFVFAAINGNQKSVDRSQTYQLYAFNLDKEADKTWSPDKAAVFMSRKLNVDKSSVFNGHILTAAQTDEAIQVAKEIKQDWAISTATIVEGILRLISANPKKDRDTMHLKTIEQGRIRSMLEDDGTPLRAFYLDVNDAVIYAAISNFFSAVDELLWQGNEGTYIKKTVGVQALFDVLRKIVRESVRSKDFSRAFFVNRLRPCHGIKFSNQFFQASGVGRQRIRTSIELCLGLEEMTNINETERETYRQICHLPQITPPTSPPL